MFAYRFKNFICLALAVIFCLFFAVGVKAVNVSRLSEIEGEHTYFLDSASSQGLRKKTLSLADLTRVKGECVHTLLSEYEGGRYATKSDVAQAIAQKYGAEILFTEEVGETVSYYGYTSKWTDGLYLYGSKINLHIAIEGDRLAVGTPIIFDGF